MSTDPKTSIEKASPAIQPCEPRYALSASLMGAWLADWVDPLQESNSTSPEPANDSFLAPCNGHDLAGNGLVAESTVDGNVDAPISPAVLGPASENAPSLGGSLLSQAAEIGASKGLDGAGQTIAVIDSGIAYDHLALGGGFGPGYRVVGGWDFAENDADPYDDGPAGYHGSHVAGLVGGLGTTDSGDSFRGVAPGADLVALRVFDDAGNGNLSWIESALQWVHTNQDTFDSPITTINLSLGTEITDANRDGVLSMLEDELQALYEDDILVFAATGNDFTSLQPDADPILYPASSQWVVGVGSLNSNGDFSDFSQREDGIYAAVGQRLVSSVPEHVHGWDGLANDYSSLSGTSMATPQVAAASALVRQAMQEAGLTPTAESILERLEETSSQHTDPVTGVAYRTINLEAAVDFGTTSSDDNTDDSPDDSPSDPTPILFDGYIGDQGSNEVTLDLRSLVSDSTGVLISDASGQYQLDLSRFQDAGDGAGISPIVIDAGGGGDTLRILGSSESESLLLRPPTGANASASRLTFLGGTIELRGFEHVSFVGGGGEDRATMYDSNGDDLLRTSDRAATLSGSGFGFNVEDVAKVYVHANAGGQDTAHLNDSVHDDQLVIRPQFTSIRGGGGFQAAFGFERVYAYADAGGHDQADLGDSSGDDVMSIAQTRSTISGPGYRASAIGFENVMANASLGGDDSVRIYVNDPGGTWHTTDSMTQWTGADGTNRIARGFERSEAFEQFEVESQTNAASIAPQANRDLDDIEHSADAHLEALRRLFEGLS